MDSCLELPQECVSSLLLSRSTLVAEFVDFIFTDTDAVASPIDCMIIGTHGPCSSQCLKILQVRILHPGLAHG